MWPLARRPQNSAGPEARERRPPSDAPHVRTDGRAGAPASRRSCVGQACADRLLPAHRLAVLVDEHRTPRSAVDREEHAAPRRRRHNPSDHGQPHTCPGHPRPDRRPRYACDRPCSVDKLWRLEPVLRSSGPGPERRGRPSRRSESTVVLLHGERNGLRHFAGDNGLQNVGAPGERSTVSA